MSRQSGFIPIEHGEIARQIILFILCILCIDVN